MSDEWYDPDGDVARYLQTRPPETTSHLLAAPDDDAVASHVGAPRHVPAPAAVQMGMTLRTPPLNPDPASGFPAPAYGVENYQALIMDVQPMQGYGFLPNHPVPAALARTTQPLPSFKATFHDDVVLRNLGTMSSLNDQLMGDWDDDGVGALLKSMSIQDAGKTDISGAAVAERTVPPVEEDLTFVPFVRGQLDCSKCRPFRELVHESANHKLYFVVHVAAAPLTTFQHAILDRTYIDADGRTIMNELMYLDLRQRTHEWVQNFIDNSVETLKNDTSGQLKDSCSTFSAAVCTNIVSTPQTNESDPYKELEMDMLKEIFSSHAADRTEAVAPHFSPEAPQPATRAEENINNADDILLRPAILESSQPGVHDGGPSGSIAGYETLIAKQRQKMSHFSMKNIINCMHKSKKDAAKELNISSTSLKRLFRKNNMNRWPGRKINAINNKIEKLQEAAKRNVGTTGLLAIKEKLDKLELERAQLYATVMKCIQDNEKHNDGNNGPSQSK